MDNNNNTDFHDTQNTDSLDFRSLPDVALVKVLQMLDVPDRYRLSLTCSRLHTMFDHPDVWRCVTLVVFGTSVAYEDYSQTLIVGDLSSQQKKLVMKRGRYFQNVVFDIGYFLLTDDIYSMLLELPERCSLKSLTVCIRNVKVFGSCTTEYQTNVLALAKELCKRVPGKISLEVDLVKCISRAVEYYYLPEPNACCSHVTSLDLPKSLFSEQDIFSENPDLSLFPTAVMVSKFPSLQCLCLSAYNLSDQLLYELSETTRRQRLLHSLDIHFKHVDLSQLPDVSSSAWNQLVSACPKVTVSCNICWSGQSISLGHNLSPLRAVIKREVPLRTVKTFCRDEKNLMQVFSVCREHTDTLTSLRLDRGTLGTDWGSLSIERALQGSFSEECQQALVDLVRECPHLTHFLCLGGLHYQTVIQLVNLDKQWRTFAVDVDYTATHDAEELMKWEPKSGTNLERMQAKVCLRDNPPEAYKKERDERLGQMSAILYQKLGFRGTL